jgi:hypothetical protein
LNLARSNRPSWLALLLVAVLAVLGAFYALALVGSSPTIDELDRITSPDGALDLVVSEVSTNATVSVPYRVSVVSYGQTPSDDDLVLTIDLAEKPTAVWVGNNGVSLRCGGGRVWFFRNFWTTRMPNGGFRNASVALECGEKGFTRISP